MPTTIEFHWPKKNRNESVGLLGVLSAQHRRHMLALSFPYACVAVSEVLILMRIKEQTERSLGSVANAQETFSFVPKMQAVHIGWIFGVLFASLILVRILEAAFTRRALVRLRREYFSLALHAEEDVWRKQPMTSRINEFVHLIDRAVQGYYVGQYHLLFVVFQMFAGLLLTVWVSPYLLVASIILFVLFQIVIGLIFPLIESALDQYVSESNRFIQMIREQSVGFQTIRNFCAKSQFYQKFHKQSLDVSQAEVRMERRVGVIQVISQLLFSFALFGMIFFLAQMVQTHHLAKTDILFILSSLAVFLIPGFILIQALPQIKTAKRILVYLNVSLQAETVPIHEADPSDQDVFLGIKDLSFSYPKIESFEITKTNKKQKLETIEKEEPVPVFVQQTLTIHRNEKVLLLGASGSGKSTLLKLLARHLHPQNGMVLLKGKNILSWDAPEVRKSIQYLEQEVFLLDASLRQNLDPSNLYEEAAILQCMRRMGLCVTRALSSAETDHDALTRPIREDGSNVSGGEKTRIALTRAILASPEILLLDEIFSGLDNKRAQEIEAFLLDLEECTILHSSHAVFASNLSRYDAIYRVENGEIHRLTQEEIAELHLL